MPLEAGENTTPMKSNWNRSNMSLNASTSFIEEVGLSNDSFLSKTCLEGTKLDAMDEEELYRHPDSSVLTASADSSACEDTSGSSSFLEKSHHSRDSGISSLADDPVHIPSAAALQILNLKDHVEPEYKISIYSKVSGCRMTNLTDYWIVKQIRVAILQRLTNGDPHLALNYKFGYEKMANGGLQIISDSETLITMLGSLGYFAGIPCKMTFPDTPRVVGFIKGLPTDLEPSDLKDEIRKTYPEVYSVRYVTEKSRGFAHGMQRPCAFISFNLRYLPKTVQIFDEVFELQVPNPMQCTRCCRYGHQGKQCRAQTRCSFCGGMHQRQVCVAKLPSCINCQGVHTATSHDCLIWQQGKYMNELRYRGGLTAEEAIGIASSGKVSQKKHCFTQADFFENQDSCYFGNDISLNSGCDDEEVSKQTSQQVTLGKVPSVHPRTLRVFPFLDLMTDLFLKVNNPEQNYTNSILMPGYDDLGFPIRKNKKSSAVAQHFKDSVMAVNKSPPAPLFQRQRKPSFLKFT